MSDDLFPAPARGLLTRQELPVVVAVLTGILPNCEFGNHGPDNNKGFSLQYQSDLGVIFCRVFTKGRVIAVSIGTQDGYYVTALALCQLRANTALVDSDGGFGGPTGHRKAVQGGTGSTTFAENLDRIGSETGHSNPQ